MIEPDRPNSCKFSIFKANILILSFKGQTAVYTNAEVVINDRNTNGPSVFVVEAKDCMDAVGGVAVKGV